MTPSDRIRSAANPPLGAGSHEHVVEFYETETFLADTVSKFIGPGLYDGGAAIVVATAQHRRLFATALRAAGVDVEHATTAERCICVDARTLLDRFMLDGFPDPQRFWETAGAARRGSRGPGIIGPR